LSDEAVGSATGLVAPDAAKVEGISLRTVELVAGYDRSPVVHGVSIEVQPEEIVSIVGPNGSGKSTLLKGLVGIVEVLSGQVLLGEREITGSSPEEIARAGVGYVPQVDDVFVPLTVKENLEMGGYLLESKEVRPRIEHVVEVFPQLGRMLSRRAGKLSGGERKMLAMGRALMLQPRLVVLDEPTANLAPMLATSVLEEHVRQLARTGASVLVVEQRAKAVLEISDRTYVMGGGLMRMEGTPAELSASPEFVESFLGGRGTGPRATHEP
jgi:ABC-type branched-subunit amino acid transport system ATPase component